LLFIELDITIIFTIYIDIVVVVIVVVVIVVQFFVVILFFCFY